MSHERRVFVSLLSTTADTEVEIDEGDAHHLRSVLRLSPGDPVTLVDRDNGVEYSSFVADAGKPFLVRLGNAAEGTDAESAVSTLLFALCKNRVNDLVAEKATELGVSRLIFWQAERSVVRYIDHADRMKRAERLVKIAEEASKQSARRTIPVVSVTADLESALQFLRTKAGERDRFFFGSLSNQARPLTALAPLRTEAHVLIGPEGDITNTEENSLLAFGFEPFTLGSNRLRSETAACAAITAIDIFRSFSG